MKKILTHSFEGAHSSPYLKYTFELQKKKNQPKSNTHNDKI